MADARVVRGRDAEGNGTARGPQAAEEPQGWGPGERGPRAQNAREQEARGGSPVDVVRAALGWSHAVGACEPHTGGADAASGDGTWSVHVDDLWCTATPRDRELPSQGWKIHVSASTGSALAVLERVCGVVVPRTAAFKCAADIALLRKLNSREADRSSSGKFITVYPHDDEAFVELAEALDAATRGLVGPGVMSDRPVRPGGIVHYRYGGFTGRSRLGNDGAYRPVLVTPDGAEVEDAREAWFAPPAWAPDPLAAARRKAASARGAAVAPGTHAPGVKSGGGVLVAGRFSVSSAIRHSAKGGVFVGTDTLTGADVIVKQARAHVEVDGSGRDARDALRHESALLLRLADSGLTPRHVALVEQDDTLFLAQERIVGTSLRAWVLSRAGTASESSSTSSSGSSSGSARVSGSAPVSGSVSVSVSGGCDGDGAGSPDVPWALARGMVGELVRVVGGMHAAGLVVRDLSPTNVLVTPEGLLRLVDLELAADAGAFVGAAGTPGYRAPEQRAAATPDESVRGVHEAAVEADFHSLGGLLFLLATGCDPGLPDDDPVADGHAARSTLERLGPWLDLAARHGRTARLLAPAIRGLMHDDPCRRWDLERLRGHLEGIERADEENRVPALAEGRDAASPDSADALIDRVLADGLAHLVATMTPERRDRLWPVTPGGAAMDPCAVQYGAAGVLGVVTRAAQTPELDAELRGMLTNTARVASTWLRERTARESVVLPGLHFGRSGTAWALLDAAELLDDDELATYAAELALSVPVRWPNPDVCHGAAGAGFTQLRLWNATGDDRFGARVVACADGLLAAAREHGDLTLWPVPKDFDSRLAGATHLGYAHGVAGIGAFLLAAGRATGRGAYLRAALAAGRTLARTVRLDDGGKDDRTGAGADRIAAWWAQGPADPPGVRLAHWCSGSSGVGTFLIRLWEATGDPVLRDLGDQAATAVRRARWHSGTTACHGLAGNGEFLLDLAERIGPDAKTYREHARECAELIVTRSALRSGRRVPCDETAIGVSASYGTGLAGVVGFLLRLRHGGPRLWTDPVGISQADASRIGTSCPEGGPVA